MKAAVITRYGSPDVVKILDAPKPSPAADEVLIRLHAATVNRTDCGELRAHPFFMRFFYGLRRPQRTIFGLDFAGEVEAVGAVTAVVATRQLELVMSLGADRAVDYTVEDFTRIGETFNSVVDAVPKTSFFRCRKLLKSDGIFIATGQDAKLVTQANVL